MADEEKSIQDEHPRAMLAKILSESAHGAFVLRLPIPSVRLCGRPLRRISTDVCKNLDPTLTQVRKCNHSGVSRQVFAIAATDDFRKDSALLESSIADVTWPLSIYQNSDGDGGGGGSTLSLPPIASNDPILAMICSSITSVKMGRPRDRICAANNLASLARDSDRSKKMIVEAGGVVPLLKLFKEGASTEAQRAAAAALSNLGNDQVQVAVANWMAQMEAMDPKVQEEFGRENVIRPLVTLLNTVLDDPTLKLRPDMAYSRFSWMCSRLQRAVLSCCSRPITETIEFKFSETIEKAMQGVARIRMKGYNVVDGVLQQFDGYATAFCFSPGLIATNCHTVCSKDLSGNFKLYDVCVDAVNQIIVPRTSVKPLAVNSGTDLAICQLPDDNNLPLIPLKLGVGSECRVGQKIFAIGHANTGSFGTRVSSIYHPSRRSNEVEISVPNSAKVPSDFCYIQSGLGTRPGMSGSPVMSTGGKVIGIHSSGTLSQPKVSHEIYTDYLLELIYWLLMNKNGSVFFHGDGVEGQSMG